MLHRPVAAGIAGFVLALAPLTTFAAPTATTVTLPGGTAISMHLTSELSSSSAHQGDKIAFSVSNDVRCGGWLVIPAGAQGVGEVTSVETAGSHGHPGKIAIRFDYVYAGDGEKVRITDTSSTTEGEQKNGAASTATIASYALLGLVGLFAHNWIKGREASITTTTPFSALVRDTVHVHAVDHAVVTDNFAR